MAGRKKSRKGRKSGSRKSKRSYAKKGSKLTRKKARLKKWLAGEARGRRLRKGKRLLGRK